jgi:hypothetical protein
MGHQRLREFLKMKRLKKMKDLRHLAVGASFTPADKESFA